MIIHFNMMAMNANRMYTDNTRKQRKVSERLSSGYRINRAADDAAGLAISEKMRRQIRGLSQAVLNVQDGISMVQIADGAMEEVHEMLHRGTELSVKAANGTLTDQDRSYIQQEIEQIKEEINAIHEKANFNEIRVLRGKNIPSPQPGTQIIIAGGLPPWVGMGSTSGLLSEVYQTTQNYEATTTNPDNTTSVTNGQETINHEAATLDFSQFTGSAQQLKDLENNGFHTTCCTCTNHYSIKFTLETGNRLEQSGNHYIYNVGIQGATTAEELMNRVIAATDNGNPRHHYTKLTVDVANKKLIIYDDRSRELNPVSPQPNTTIKWTDWSNPSFSVRAGGDRGKFAPGTAYSAEDALKVATVDWVVLQTGTERGDVLSLELPSISTLTLGISDVDVSTQDKARKAIAQFKEASSFVSEERSRMGAYQNRLEHTIANLNNVIENTQAAESVIRDADMAKLMVEYANRSILEQAGAAVLTQANKNHQGILNMLE